jgi:hypothetical protein
MIIQLKIQKNWSYSAYIEILITPGLPTGCLSRKKQKKRCYRNSDEEPALLLFETG